MTQNDSIDANDAVLHDGPSGRKLGFYKVRLSEREAWFGTMVAASFNALGMSIEFAVVRRIPGISPRPAAISAFVGLMLLMVLFMRRKTPSHKLAAVVYLFMTASIVTALLWTNLQYAVSVRNWVPFQASKLGGLIAAIIAPGFGLGLLSILAYCLSALLQFEFFFPPELKARVASGEPWPIIAYGLAAIFALIYRFRQAQLEQELARIQARNFAIRELTNAFLNIRDLMNTPLQVIEFSINVLRHSNERPQPILDRIDRSVQSLRKINAVLVQHEKEIEWQAKR